MRNYCKNQQFENKRREEIRQNTLYIKIKEYFEYNQEKLLNKDKEFVFDVRVKLFTIN